MTKHILIVCCIGKRKGQIKPCKLTVLWSQNEGNCRKTWKMQFHDDVTTLFQWLRSSLAWLVHRVDIPQSTGWSLRELLCFPGFQVLETNLADECLSVSVKKPRHPSTSILSWHQGSLNQFECVVTHCTLIWCLWDKVLAGKDFSDWGCSQWT